MPHLKTLEATVTAIESAGEGIVRARAQVAGEASERRIVAYPTLTGPLFIGQSVTLNVTATALNLGTGGEDFVMAPARPEAAGEGHIVKLRYTPHQHAVTACELSEGWSEPDTLDGAPVIACLLHSQIAPVAAGVRAARPDARIAYVMTDSAALPLALSRLVERLKGAQLLSATLTCGQAFGGDLECVSLPSALLAARAVARADAIIVAPGPGMAGTGTRYGFSGIEQAWTLDLAAALGGRAIFCLRASGADERERHRGISHHSHAVLSLCTRRPKLAWPTEFPGGPDDATLCAGAPGLALLEARGVEITSMGRSPLEDPLFFHAASAAGRLAAEAL